MMNPITIYVAGPMSHRPRFNHAQFDQVTRVLRRLGHTVISPAENARALYPEHESEPGFEEGVSQHKVGSHEYEVIMRADVKSVCDADWLVCLPEWETSVGATIERRVAECIGLEIFTCDFTDGDADWVTLTRDPVQRRCDASAQGIPVVERYTETVMSDGGVLLEEAKRTFRTGATRDTDAGKLDFEGFLSPAVLVRFAEYMHEHRLIDGELRASDNWQNGFPLDVYIKSLWRHFMDLWLIHRGLPMASPEVPLEHVLCAIMFNAMGYLHVVLNDSER